MKIIDKNLLDRVSQQAKDNPRLRMNYNFHESLDDPINRLLNAMEPGTYLPPHRHINPDKNEVFIVLRGSVLALLFDDNGDVMSSMKLSPQLGVWGLEIEPGTWHSLIVLEENTVVYEIKDGPYAPISPDNLASWAPKPDADQEEIEKFISYHLEKYLD
ncbi:MAG: WbuC family cupin fold metalloprotein [Dysgonomonas sp.]|nr:WbuC family cupin fold metalloprotein [Dysgonomonas sp.]